MILFTPGVQDAVHHLSPGNSLGGTVRTADPPTTVHSNERAPTEEVGRIKAVFVARDLALAGR
jgi:hypothetical protein